MQRACAAALIRPGYTRIKNAGHSADDAAALQIVADLGAVSVNQLQDGSVDIVSRGVICMKDTIHCGESGLSFRMFTPIAALCDRQLSIAGEGSLLNRPMDFFETVMPLMGVQIQTNAGKPPIILQGPLVPVDIEIDASLSSQFLTGLLMAYAAAGARNVSIKVKSLASKPYIDLTLDVMKKFGLKVPVNRNYEAFYFEDKPHFYESNRQEYQVEADWSNAAFLLVAGAIAGPVVVRGLDLSSAQADRAITDALMAANASIAMDVKGISVHPGHMDGFYFDATDSPDLFPPLVALAAYCKGKTSIKGVGRLIHKESNRALALQDEFDKMGVYIELDSDIMIVHGGRKVKGADVHSQFDHRIAMACAVAALKADGETVIEEAQAVRKSYPDFFEDLKKLGAAVSLPFTQSNH